MKFQIENAPVFLFVRRQIYHYREYFVVSNFTAAVILYYFLDSFILE